MKTKTGITNKIGIIIIDQLVPADFLLKEAHAVMVITADLCMISNHLAKQNIAGFSTKILYQSQLDNEKKDFSLPSVHVCYLICLYTYKILSNLSCFLAILAILPSGKKTPQNYPRDDKDYHIIHTVYAINSKLPVLYIIDLYSISHHTSRIFGINLSIPCYFKRIPNPNKQVS